MLELSNKFYLKIRNFRWFVKEYYAIAYTVFFRLIVFFYRKCHKELDDEIYVGFSSEWFGGNVKALLFAFLKENEKKHVIKDKKIHIYFTSTDKEQVNISRQEGIEAYWWHDLSALSVFSKTKLFVSSHGERLLPTTRRQKFSDFLRDVTGEVIQKFHADKPMHVNGNFAIKRMELFHGIPFKDVDIDKIPIPPDIFCVTSEFMKKCYLKKGYRTEIFRITGYPRDDVLFSGVDKGKLLSKLGIPDNKKIVLYTPTWGHLTSKGLFPWDDWEKTLLSLDKFAKTDDNVYFIVRTHKCWRNREIDEIKKVISNCSNIGWIPMEKYPDTYSLLAITDVLITDWSSIAFDFMLKKKPIIFVDCENPYKKFYFTPEERAGAIVKNSNELINAVSDSLEDRSKFLKKYAPNFDIVLDKAFTYKDGKASERCLKELKKLLNN